MIKPHGSDKLNPLYVQDDAKRAALLKEAEGLPSIVVSSAAAANAVMMGAGYFNPLTGFMNLADALSVAENMQTTNGLFWPVPIVNVVQDAAGIQGATRIAGEAAASPIELGVAQDARAVEEHLQLLLLRLVDDDQDHLHGLVLSIGVTPGPGVI